MKIFNCLEGMRQQIRLRSIKFLLLGVLSLWLLAPAVVSAQVVEIPDPNLRAALAEALNKAPGDAITRAEMETLVRLRARSREITDLRGIEFAINLTALDLTHNSISDISPVASLTNLTTLALWFNTISDISALLDALQRSPEMLILLDTGEGALGCAGVDLTDPMAPRIVVNASGNPNYVAQIYSIEDFRDAWSDAEFHYIRVLTRGTPNPDL